MSTRGAVGFYNTKAKNSWKAVYNNSDSYIEGLGAELYTYLTENKINLSVMKVELYNHYDYRNYLSGGLCKYCGKLTTQPHSITVSIIDDKMLFPDPDCLNHKHTALTEKSYILSKNAKEDALFIEWVYIIDIDTNSIDVFVCARAKGSHKESSADGLRTWDSPNYKYSKVANIKLNEPLTDETIKAIDKTADTMRDKANDQYSK
jgi:hypothetical protein